MNQGTNLFLTGLALASLGLVGCNADPSDQMKQQVDYRDGIDGDANSGERGTVKVTEVMWSGSVTNDGQWNPTDVFIEIRNEGSRPVNLTGWQLQIEGTIYKTLIIPPTEEKLAVGDHAFVARTDSGCFTGANWIMPELELPYGDPFRVTVRDADERLMASAGDRYMPPFAGGYDGALSRSMEKLELMFGGRGNEPASWHYYTPETVDTPNNDKVKPICQERTLASPGRPNSPDYSGAFAAGDFQ